MTYQWDFSLFYQYRGLMLNAALVTFQLVALSVVLGILVGLALAPLRMAERRLLRYPATAVIEVVRSVPPLVLVVWSYYCLPILTGLALPAFWTCVFARALRPFTSQCVMAIKNSVLGSYIAVGEILYEGQRLSIHTFRPLEVLTLVAAFFVAVILPLTLTAGAIERRIFLKYFRR